MKLYRLFDCRSWCSRHALLVAGLVASSSLLAAENDQRPDKRGEGDVDRSQVDRGPRDLEGRGPRDRGPRDRGPGFGGRGPRPGGPFNREAGGPGSQDFRSQGFKPEPGRTFQKPSDAQGRGFRPGGPMAAGDVRGAEMMSRMIPVIAVLDADKDGVISAKEIAGAADALKKLDRNDDGKLTIEELRPSMGQRAAMAGRRPDFASPEGRGPEGRGPEGRGPESGRPGMERVEFMIRMFTERDANKDGMLSGDEIPEQMAARLDRLDANGDGAVSREEVKEAANRIREAGAGGSRPQRGSAGAATRPEGRGPRPGGEVPRRPAADK